MKAWHKQGSIPAFNFTLITKGFSMSNYITIEDARTVKFSEEQVAALEKAFRPPTYNADDPLLSQKLLIREGQYSVLSFIKSRVAPSIRQGLRP